MIIPSGTYATAMIDGREAFAIIWNTGLSQDEIVIKAKSRLQKVADRENLSPPDWQTLRFKEFDEVVT